VPHNIAFIGLDTHKETIAVAIAEDGRAGEVRYYGQIANDPAGVLKLVKKLAGKYDKLHFCYEAGPCGYSLQRQLTGLGHDCVVIAPSHTPTKRGVTSRTTAVMLWSWPGCTVPAT
jgi:transposase